MQQPFQHWDRIGALMSRILQVNAPYYVSKCMALIFTFITLALSVKVFDFMLTCQCSMPNRMLVTVPVDH